MSAAAYAIQEFQSPAIGDRERATNIVRFEAAKNPPLPIYYILYCFNQYKNKWVEQTINYSNPYMIYNNRYYKQIIAMGAIVIPLIFKDLLETDHDWFDALTKLTGANPVQEDNYGDIEEMKKDWLAWATSNRII